MHQSLFSYNLSRPYPFVWFTPVVIVGGILFTVLFSVINLATNGYYLKTIYTTNPNGTIAEKHWFTEAPWSWGDKMKPTCQAQDIPIGYQFFTTNLGLHYTLTGVSQYDPASGQTIPLPSLRYLNHTLEDCYIDQVILHMEKDDESYNGLGYWWSWDDSSANAYAHCRVESTLGPVNASFSTSYKPGPKDYSYAITNNYTSAASMWWGTRLLNLYWWATLEEMARALYPYNATYWTDTPIYTKGQIAFVPNITTDIRTYDYFNLNYYFLAANANLLNYVDDLDIMYNNNDTAYSGPLTEGMYWAKIMSSMVLTDLGDSSYPNILQSPDLLQWALQYPDNTFQQSLDKYSCPYISTQETPDCDPDWYNYLGITAPILNNPSAPSNQQTPMNQSYNAFKSQMGPLGTKPAEIYLQYACSVPERKDTGTLFLTILISDLVFLSACWSILKYIAVFLVARRDRAAMYCRGHVDQEYGLVGYGDEGKTSNGGSEVNSRELLVGENGGGGNDNVNRNGYSTVS